jgi:hypothetical protein
MASITCDECGKPLETGKQATDKTGKDYVAQQKGWSPEPGNHYRCPDCQAQAGSASTDA